MNKHVRAAMLVATSCCLLSILAADLWGRGGFGGGGGRGGGGGGGFRGGGGGGMGGGGRAPSMSRPAPRPSGGGGARPSGGAANRPSPGPANRPGGGTARPSPRPGVANRPGGASGPGNVRLPNGSTRPGNSARPPANVAGGNRPALTPGGNRPQIGTQPGTGLGNRPNIGSAPGAGARPGTGNRPGIGNSPGVGTLPAGPGRPGGAAGRPGGGLGSGPGAGIANRPGQRPATLPGLGVGGGLAGGGLGGVGDGNRPNWNDRPNAGRDWMNDRVANREGRASQLEDRMSNRGENQQDRQDRRNENQDNRQERRDDWSENFWDNAYDMRHDYWDNRFDAWSDHMWDEHPVGMALGVTAWGVNRLSYWFGYGGGYANPYYGDGGGGGGGYSGGGSYDYSQPLPTYEQVSSEPATAEAAPADAVVESSSGTASPAPAAEGQSAPLMTAFDETRQAFYSGDYKLAMDKVNAALALAPNDALLHEVKALILFAEGQYKDAAATIHTVLAVGPGWDWTTLSGMYPSVDAYTAQLRKLEDAVRANPNDAALHFLTAYHYITCNSTNEAVAQLRDVLRLQPKDTVALQLLEMLVGPQVAQPSAAGGPPKAGSTAPEPVSVPAKDLVGDWKAKGDRGSNFELKLTDKNTFTWTYSEKGKSKSIEGVYAVEQNTLALQPDAGGVMAAEVTPPKDGKFHFQVVGAPAGDRGLDFAK